MASEITHKGRIVEITPEVTSVEIISESACSACHAKGLCGLGESKTKLVQLPTRAWESRSVGDEVTLAFEATMGHKAVWLAYVIPLVVLVAALMLGLQAGAGELAAGLIAIGCVAVYYLVIWALCTRLRNEYIFNIKK